MQITVYADLLFCTNFFSGLFLLLTTEKILHFRAKRQRRFFAALLGAAYAVCVYIKPLAFLGHPLFLLASLTLVLFCAFSLYSLKHFLRVWLVFLCVHALYGGLCYALFFTSGLGFRLGAALKSGILYLHIPFYIPPLAFLLGYGLLRSMEIIFTNTATRKKHLHKITFTLNEKSYALSALLDTGNALFDPQSHLPVVITQSDAVQVETQFSHHIPYRTLAGEVHTLPALQIKTIYIDGRDAGSCMLALTPACLSPDGLFCALLHPALFQGGYDDHFKNTSTQDPRFTCR